MGRVKEFLGQSGLEVHYDITETFTHRIETSDGRILRGDPAARFWYEKRPIPATASRASELAAKGTSSSWYGDPPSGWDPSHAVKEDYSRKFEGWWDVS